MDGTKAKGKMTFTKIMNDGDLNKIIGSSYGKEKLRL